MIFSVVVPRGKVSAGVDGGLGNEALARTSAFPIEYEFIHFRVSKIIVFIRSRPWRTAISRGAGERSAVREPKHREIRG